VRVYLLIAVCFSCGTKVFIAVLRSKLYVVGEDRMIDHAMMDLLHRSDQIAGEVSVVVPG